MGAVRPQTPLRLFDKKVRPAAQERVRETADAVEGERSGASTVAPKTAEQEQAFACVLIIVIGNKG